MKLLKQKQNRIFAIDPSPNGTGFALIESGLLVDYRFCTQAKGPAKKNERAILVPKVKLADESGRMERLHIVDSTMVHLCRLWQPSMVAMEDYTFGGGNKSGGTLQIGELGGVLRLHLWKMGYQTRTYHPGSVKLFWTGRGDAEKKDMIAQAMIVLDRTGCLLLSEFKKLAMLYQEAISDALAIGLLLVKELSFRRGEWLLNGAPEGIVRVFNRVTDSMPVCLIDRLFMERENK